MNITQGGGVVKVKIAKQTNKKKVLHIQKEHYGEKRKKERKKDHAWQVQFAKQAWTVDNNT